MLHASSPRAVRKQLASGTQAARELHASSSRAVREQPASGTRDGDGVTFFEEGD